MKRRGEEKKEGDYIHTAAQREKGRGGWDIERKDRPERERERDRDRDREGGRDR